MSSATPPPSSATGSALSSRYAPTTAHRLTALSEAALVATLMWGLHALLRWLDAPVAVRATATVFTLATCTCLLRRRGEHWRDLGLDPHIPWRRTVLWTVGLFVAQMLSPALLARPLADSLGFGPQRLDAFANIQGNLGVYLLLLIPVGWGAAGFGEELIYRGFIFGRLAHALGGSRLAQGCALVLQATLFALGHRYLGARGVLNAGLLGVLSGAAYIANGRTLWPLIIAHAAVDSLGLTAMYLGVGTSPTIP